MNKKIRSKIAGISFAVAVLIALFFLVVYAFGVQCEPLKPVLDALVMIEIIAVLAYLWGDR